MLRFFVFLTALCLPLLAQGPVGIGVKGGFSVPDDVSGSGASSESRLYIVGPMVDFRLPLHLGIEVDALYSRLGYRYSVGSIGGFSTSRARANSWELPVLLKYRLPVPLVHPYVSGGVAPRYASGTINTGGVNIDLGTGARTPFNLKEQWGAIGSLGIVVAGGVEFGTRHFRIAPEIRYTHWDNDIIGVNDSHGFQANANQNQVRILVGLSFR